MAVVVEVSPQFLSAHGVGEWNLGLEVCPVVGGDEGVVRHRQDNRDFFRGSPWGEVVPQRLVQVPDYDTVYQDCTPCM